MSGGDYERAMQYANAQPDFAGGWIDLGATARNNPGVTTNPNDRYREAVVVAAFTGDSARHQVELERLWGGPVCVVQRSRTRAR